MLAGAFNLPRAVCLWISAMILTPEGTGDVLPPIVHLVAGFVKHLPHIWMEASPPHAKRQIPPPAVRPHQLELWKVASHDCIKKDDITCEVPCCLMLDSANIVYPYESRDVFLDESLYTVLIRQQVSLYNLCRHVCFSLPIPNLDALWCNRCLLEMNLHPKR